MEDAALRQLKEKLADEERIYAELLARLDSLSETATPYGLDPELPALIRRLNETWDAHRDSAPPLPGGVKGLLRRAFRRLAEPELGPFRETLARQRSFNSLLVQFLNRYVDAAHRRAARLQEFASALVQFAQRIDRLADAKDRLYASLANTRTDLLLEAMDRRLEAASVGLRRAESHLEGLLSSVELARSDLGSLRRKLDSPPRRTRRLEPAAAPFSSPEYVAFENRYRGSFEDIRERLAPYLPHFQGMAPVVELGCGRGEFLELLREAGVEARGVDGNANMVGLCRERGLAVEQGDLLAYLRSLPEESVGGIFAAQVIEHLPPPVLREALASCHRGLRKGGRLVLETVNPRSVVALIESFHRDLTHQKPLHPETLDFLLRACGFREVAIEYRSPVEERAKLLPISPEADSARTLNENFRKLNAFLFGDQDYAAIATK